jgi:hypothetical protein
MALPGVKNKILDGAMGVLGADATGVFAAVGVSAKPSDGILIFTDPASVAKLDPQNRTARGSRAVYKAFEGHSK